MVRKVSTYESASDVGLAEQGQDFDEAMFKPVMVLAFTLFMLIAPDPDASDIAEMTSGFITPAHHSAVLPPD